MWDIDAHVPSSQAISLSEENSGLHDAWSIVLTLLAVVLHMHT